MTDPNGALPVTIADGTRKYVWGLGLAYAVSGSTLEVYHADRLGSIRALTDGTGAVTATYRTDAWGISTAQTGSSTQPFGFTGEPRDATGLSYLRARYYDPTLGRFLSRDPWGGAIARPCSMTRYPYAYNNPVRFVDPAGMDPGSPDATEALASCGNAQLARQIGQATTAIIEIAYIAGSVGGAVTGGAGVVAGAGLTLSILAVDYLLDRIVEETCRIHE